MIRGDKVNLGYDSLIYVRLIYLGGFGVA